jgi:hypothetical protein
VASIGNAADVPPVVGVVPSGVFFSKTVWFIMFSNIQHNVILRHQWDGISCNKVVTLHTLGASSFELLHNWLQAVLSFRAVDHLSLLSSVFSERV